MLGSQPGQPTSVSDTGAARLSHAAQSSSLKGLLCFLTLWVLKCFSSDPCALIDGDSETGEDQAF